MTELRYLTSGESHGRCLTAILTGFPCGVEISQEEINNELTKRQSGYGRGDRMKIEKDEATICSGIRNGLTTGAPITITINNKDWENWLAQMSISPENFDASRNVTRPRPGHADLPGGLKFDQKDIRNILERASARGTASQVAIGSLCKQMLSKFNIRIFSHTINIGGVRAETKKLSFDEIAKLSEKSELRCADSKAEMEMKWAITEAKECGDTLGGVIEAIILGVPAGIGSCMNPDEKLDGLLAGAVMSIQAIKGVEIGMGFEVANNPGSQVHDEIYYSKEKCGKHLGYGKSGYFFSTTNNAGGIEGGISNGRPIIIRAAMKPIPSLAKPLQSVDIISKEPFEAIKERADICAVPAAGVVIESVSAYILLKEFLKKFGGDSFKEIMNNYSSFVKQMEEF